MKLVKGVVRSISLISLYSSIVETHFQYCCSGVVVAAQKKALTETTNGAKVPVVHEQGGLKNNSFSLSTRCPKD